MRWDADEAWTLDPQTNGILLGHVTKHEIGHLLGLTHTSRRGQLMLPTYSPAIGDPQEEDRQRVYLLYGPPSSKPAAPAAGRKVEVRVRIDNGDVYAGELTKQAA
jgi:hypothetical protein